MVCMYVQCRTEEDILEGDQGEEDHHEEEEHSEQTDGESANCKTFWDYSIFSNKCPENIAVHKSQNSSLKNLCND